MSSARERAVRVLADYDARHADNEIARAHRCAAALRALLAEPASLRDAIEIEREGQRSMARALAEINRLSRLDVAVNLAEPAGESGSVSTVRSDDPPAKPLPTCGNCGSNFITPSTAPVPCDGHGETYDEVWRDRERLRERLDQFEAYDITVASALADRDLARTLEHIGTGAGLAVRAAMQGGE